MEPGTVMTNAVKTASGTESRKGLPVVLLYADGPCQELVCAGNMRAVSQFPDWSN